MNHKIVLLLFSASAVLGSFVPGISQKTAKHRELADRDDDDSSGDGQLAGSDSSELRAQCYVDAVGVQCSEVKPGKKNTNSIGF